MPWPPELTPVGRRWLTAADGLARGKQPRMDQPWLAWLLLALCRQRHRQTWHRRIWVERLSPAPGQEGEVPGLAGWRYFFHGRGLALHGPEGECVDVDDWGDDGASIDPIFFAHRVLGLERPEPVERELARWLPTDQWIVEGILALRRLGLAGHPESRWVFRLHPTLELRHAELSQLTDAPLAAFAGDPGLAGPLTPSFRRWLMACLGDRARLASLMGGARQLLGDEALLSTYRRVLAGKVDSAAGKTIELLNDAPLDLVAEVRRFRERLDPRQHHPYPAVAACRYLLDRGQEVDACLETVQAFAAIHKVPGYSCNPLIHELAMLLLEHDPQRAASAVVTALTEGSPGSIQSMSALLATLDRPWCHAALVHALQSRVHEEATYNKRMLVAGLLHSRWESVRAQAEAHALGKAAEASLGFSLEQLTEANLDPWFRQALDYVEPVAHRIEARWKGQSQGL